MGIRMPGSTTGLFDPNVVKQLIELESQPIESAKRRKEQFEVEKEEFQKIQDLVFGLDSALNSLKTKADFYKMKIESSHPDIIDGVVEGYAMPGNFEFEVRGLARADKKLAFGFPDRDKTPVGFGYMSIEREDKGDFEVIIEPGSTLQQVANQINDAEAGVRAMVINTKYKPDSYRLLVISEESGQEAKIKIDEDTTFLEFKNQVMGRNLEVLFEDVPVTDNDNTLEELVDGIVFNVHRSEPGTRVQVNVVYDVDAAVEAITEFVNKYNELAKAINQQFQVNPQTNRAGVLAGDGSIKSIMRRLQNSIVQPINTGGKFRTLGEIGITTNPKTGELDYNDSKVKQSLSEDYISVANLFIRSQESLGVAARLADNIQALRDPTNGVLRTRMRTMERILQNQDEEIEKRERTLVEREESIRRRFSSLEGQLAGLKAQGDFLAQRMGGSQGGKDS
ncbi:MAG: flagellar filament capping protein FliD [Oligoflexus sp.]